MPHLADSKSSQTPPMLVRKFSWEDDYYESKSNPVGDSSGVKPLNIDKHVPVNPAEGHGTWEHVPRGGAFKVRRKPINIDRASRFDRLSNSSGSISSVASRNSSPPESVSSRSSSASPPPQPTRLPPSPPRTPPIPPQKCQLRKANMPQIQCVSKNPLILPVELNPRPHTRGQSPPSPTGLIIRDSVVQVHGNKLFVPRAQLPPSRPRAIADNLVVPQNRPTTSTDKSAKSGVSRRGSGGSGGSVSPASSTGHYTAALDIGRAFRAPNVSVATKHGETGKPTSQYPTNNHTVVRTSPPPVPSKNTPHAKPLSPRYRGPFSRSKNISTTKPLTPIYAGDTPPSPPLEGRMSSPLTPPIHYRPQSYFDPKYRGGYESDDSISPPIRERYLSMNSEQTPVYRPPKSPGSPSRERPSRPRITTDLNSVEPLNVKHVPTPKEVHFANELTSAEMQSEELTDILDCYLDEVVTDAASRGVMSSGLKEFLKSPTIMGEWKKGDVVYTVQDTGGKGKGVRSVSIVRRALRG